MPGGSVPEGGGRGACLAAVGCCRALPLLVGRPAGQHCLSCRKLRVAGWEGEASPTPTGTSVWGILLAAVAGCKSSGLARVPASFSPSLPVYQVLGPDQHQRHLPLLPHPEMMAAGIGWPGELSSPPGFLQLCIYTAMYTDVHFCSIGNVCIESLYPDQFSIKCVYYADLCTCWPCSSAPHWEGLGSHGGLRVSIHPPACTLDGPKSRLARNDKHWSKCLAFLSLM